MRFALAAGMESMASLIDEMEKNRFFSEWKGKNKAAYLSSVFVMVPDVSSLSEHNWQASEWLFSYYDPEDDTFTTFSSSGVQRAAKEQAFKKKKTLPELEKGSIKAEVWSSIKAAEEVRLDKYKEEVGSVVAILQPLSNDEIFGSGNSAKAAAKLVWNITYITKAYKVLNIKIDAETGKVLAHSSSGVMDFMQDGNALEK